MRGVYIPLTKEEREALAMLGQIERRDPRDQAALMLRQVLERQGLLQPTSLVHSVIRKGANDDC